MTIVMSRKRQGHLQRPMPAQLITVRGDKALIKPRRHGRSEWVPLSSIKPWRDYGNAG